MATKTDFLQDWQTQERAAEAMIPIIGSLFRDRCVEISFFGQRLIKQPVQAIIKAHKYTRQLNTQTLWPADTLPLLEQVQASGVEHAHIDIGKLAIQQNGQDLTEFVKQQLASVLDQPQSQQTPKDVVLYGFGRIGRLVARLLIDRTGGSHRTRLRAIVLRKKKGNDLEKRASLLRFDSVHGPFEGVIEVDNDSNTLIINGQNVQVIYANSPEEVDYARYGINNAVVVDNTGVWRDKEGLSKHLASGNIDKVLLTAPGKDDIKNIVHGINQDTIEDSDHILSAASCTTNAIAPVLKVINEALGIKSGHMETIHSFTNDQNLIDNYHAKDRRGRSAPLNMVLTTTGATKAVAKALPELEGKITGGSVRVPTPNVSMAILALNLETSPSAEQINKLLRDASLYSDMHKQIGYSNAPDAVSSDFVGMRNAGVVDAQATQAGDGRCVVYVWYDNEYGYSCQVTRIVRQITGSDLPSVP